MSGVYAAEVGVCEEARIRDSAVLLCVEDAAGLKAKKQVRRSRRHVGGGSFRFVASPEGGAGRGAAGAGVFCLGAGVERAAQAPPKEARFSYSVRDVGLACLLVFCRRSRRQRIRRAFADSCCDVCRLPFFLF